MHQLFSQKTPFIVVGVEHHHNLSNRTLQINVRLCLPYRREFHGEHREEG